MSNQSPRPSSRTFLARIGMDNSHSGVERPHAQPRAWDWMIAFGLAVGVVVQLLVTGSDRLPIRLLPAAVALLLLPFRKQIPLYAAVGAFFAQMVFDRYARSQDFDGTATIAHLLAGLMLIYALCRWETLPRVAAGMTLTMTMVAATDVADADDFTTDVLAMEPWIFLALFALAMRYRASLVSRQVHEERLAERNALARDLHDSVAHHVSAIAVQAQAAQFIAATNPDGARNIMANVEAIANTTIDDMRSLVGILRSDTDRDTTVAASLADLAGGEARPLVRITGEASLEHLPGPVASAVYRIAQETITNARRHSRNATFVDVDLATGDQFVVLEVTNDGVPRRHRSAGFGLTGMEERVRALGGVIEIGPRSVSGWRVEARIPLRRSNGPSGSGS